MPSDTAGLVVSRKRLVRTLIWALAIVVVFGCGFLVLRNFDSTLLVAEVESINGDLVKVSVSDPERTFEVEYVGSGLETGDTVIIQVQGEDASLEFVSPLSVRVVSGVKRLIP